VVTPNPISQAPRGPATIFPLRIDRASLKQGVRTTLAAVVSAMIARACGLPEPIWAVISTIIVMQSSLGAARQVWRDRLLGTALGTLTGAALLTFFPSSLAVLAVGLLVMAIVCALTRQPHSAYRFAGITLAIIVLPAYTAPAWVISLHRFLETVVGLVVGMIVMALWRGADPAIESIMKRPDPPQPTSTSG